MHRGTQRCPVSGGGPWPRTPRRFSTLAGALPAALWLLTMAVPARCLEIKLWPLIDYRHDAASDHTVLNLLGPLVSYESGPDRSLFALRPLLLWKHEPGPMGHVFALLYPLSIFRWDDEISTATILGLMSLESRAHETADEEHWDQRFTIYPLIFYRSSEERGTWLSVLPFYANLENVFGYQKINMLLFPIYLRLEEPLGTRTWAPFPFVSWSSGPLSDGWRIWPFYGWQDSGGNERFSYILWPFYIHYERPVDAEVQTNFAIFYSRIDSPKLRSRSYFTLFFHSTDIASETETWGFPWPLWVYQTRGEEHERTMLRLVPFYGNQQRGNFHTRFYLWPLYRIRTVEDEDYYWERRDFLLTIGQSIEEEQFSYHRSRSISTLFPLWRDVVNDDERHFSTLALVDAITPFNDTMNNVYAPIWRVYTRDEVGDRPAHWSLLWDLISSDGERLRYPIALDFSDEDNREPQHDDAD